MRPHQQAQKLDAAPDEAATVSVSHQQIAVNIHQPETRQQQQHQRQQQLAIHQHDSVRIPEPVSDGDQSSTSGRAKVPAVVIQMSSVAMQSRTSKRKVVAAVIRPNSLKKKFIRHKRVGEILTRPSIRVRSSNNNCFARSRRRTAVSRLTDCKFAITKRPIRAANCKLVARQTTSRLANSRAQVYLSPKTQFPEACSCDNSFNSIPASESHQSVDQIKTETPDSPDNMTAVTLNPIQSSPSTNPLHLATGDDDDDTSSTTTPSPTSQEHDHERDRLDLSGRRHFGLNSVCSSTSVRHLDRQDKITEAQLDRLSSLIKIIRNGDYQEFAELLEERSFKNLLNVFVDGQTALHYSLIYGRSLAWCKQLVLNGANPNLTNRAGWHPIHLAAFNGSRETMRYLIDYLAG